MIFLGVTPNSFCYNKHISDSGVEKGWLILPGNTQGTTNVLVTADWNTVWLDIYYQPNNSGASGSYGSFKNGYEWSVIENHFGTGLSIYSNRTKLCFKLGVKGKILIEFTAMRSHWAATLTIEPQDSVDVTGWTQIHPTT